MKQSIRTTMQLSLRIFLIVGLLAGALAVSGAQSAHAWGGATIVVDDFNSGAFTSSTFIDDLTAAGAIGGRRDVLVQDSGGGSVSSVMSLTPGNGYLNLAVGDSPGNYQIGWGARIFSNDSGLNLNASGHDRIVVTLSEAPSSGVITVITEKVDMFVNRTLTSSLPLSGAGDYTFMFSSFGPLDPSDIDGIQIVLDQGVSASSTVRFESIGIEAAECPAGQYDNNNGCLVDDFNSGAFSIDGPSGYFMDLPAPGAIDGGRDVLVQDSTPALTPSIMSLTPGDDYLNLAVGSLPGNYQIGWGTLFFSGGAELNLDASRYDRVVVTLSEAPSSGVITVITEKVDMYMFPDRTLTSSLPLSGAGDYTFMFSSGFCRDIDSPDRCDVDGIQIVLDQGVSAFSTVRFESIVIGSAGVLGPAGCQAGQYDNGSDCVDASPGYYVPVAGATEQTPCAPGFYQPNAGSVSCIPADAGHYVDVYGAAMQIDCLPGSYQPNAGSVSCDLPSPGHYVDVTAAAMQIDCLPGSYQPNTGATSCILASPNYYVPVSAAIEQTPCPAGYISEAGATECTLAPDVTAPTITLTTPANGATYLLNQAVIAGYACQDEAGGSGLASCVGTVPDGSAIDTSSVGAKSFKVNAADNAGNPNSATVSYNVVYNFSGFSSPVDIAPTLNVAKAGQSIPLKWRITDASGVPVTNLSGVTVTVASLLCSLGTTTDALEEYASGSSGLQNLGDGYYQFNWKTPKTYANSCKTLKLNLGEGSGFEHTALFKFTK